METPACLDVTTYDACLCEDADFDGFSRCEGFCITQHRQCRRKTKKCPNRISQTTYLCSAHQDNPRFTLHSNFIIDDYKLPSQLYEIDLHEKKRDKWAYAMGAIGNTVVLTLSSALFRFVSFYFSNYERVDKDPTSRGCFLTYPQPKEGVLTRGDQRYVGLYLTREGNDDRLQIIYEYGPVHHNLTFMLSAENENQVDFISSFISISRRLLIV